MEVVGFEFEVSLDHSLIITLVVTPLGAPSFSQERDLSSSITKERTELTVRRFLFVQQGEWKAKVPESSTVFEDIVFEDGRWDEYDEEVSSSPVSFLSIFVRVELTLTLLPPSSSNQSKLPCSIEDLEAKWVKA